MLRQLISLFPALDAFLSRDTFPVRLLLLATTLADILLVCLVAKIVSKILHRISDRAFRRRIEKTGDASHYNTLSRLFHHGITALVWFFAITAILSLLGLTGTVYSMLATAGIGGIAIGLGAQSLIKDVISGGFLLGEQQIAVGDYVTLAGLTGTVEDINMRTTRLRAGSGELHVIPNGIIDVVTNFSRGTNRALVDVPMPYDADPEQILSLLKEAMAAFAVNNTSLVSPPEVLGIVEYGNSAIMLRIIAHCKDLEHWQTERAIRAAVLKAFEQKGISIPYPTIVLAHADNDLNREKGRLS